MDWRPEPLSSSRARQQHRHVRLANHPFRAAAQQGSADTPAPMRPHHDQVCRPGAGKLQNALLDRPPLTVAEHGFGHYAGGSDARRRPRQEFRARLPQSCLTRSRV